MRFLLLLVLPFFLAASHAAPPNIILLYADDLGWGDLSCYGQKNFQTPHLDQMAAQGLRFTQCYAGSTVCGPSRSALLTGLHTGHTRIRGNGDLTTLQAADVTLGRTFQEAGYATALFGKWGMGDPGTPGLPDLHGWQHFLGYLNHVHAHNHYPAFLWKNGAKFPLPNVVPAMELKNPERQSDGAGVATVKKAYASDVLGDAALDWLRSQPAEQPFLLFMSYVIPHANNEAKDKGMEVPDYGPYADKPWPDPDKGRAAMIHRLDAHVGRVLALLREQKRDEQTLVLFSSDNGPHQEGGAQAEFHRSSGPYSGWKRSLKDGGIRVPLIAHWPGKIKPGTTDLLCAQWDFFPTLAELAALPKPETLDGVSLVPTLLGKPDQAQHKHLYWEFYEQGTHRAVKTSQWKYIYSVKKGKEPTQELYAVSDVAETQNVAAQHPQVVAELHATLLASRTPSSVAAWNP